MTHWFLRLRIREGLRNLGLSPYLRAIDAEDYETFEHRLDGPTAPEQWESVPVRTLGLVRGLILTTDQAIAVRVYWQTGRAINLDAGGIIVLWDVNMRTVTQPVIEVQYAGTDPVTLQGLQIGHGLEEEFTA
jgi:hypothetical protein